MTRLFAAKAARTLLRGTLPRKRVQRHTLRTQRPRTHTISCTYAHSGSGTARAMGKLMTKNFVVTGDFSRMIYSRHCTRAAAEKACKALAKKWGYSHLGSEPRVVEVGAIMPAGWAP